MMLVAGECQSVHFTAAIRHPGGVWGVVQPCSGRAWRLWPSSSQGSRRQLSWLLTFCLLSVQQPGELQGQLAGPPVPGVSLQCVTQ